MNKTAILGGPMGIIAGVILGALTDNMAIGIIVGLALCFGIIKISGKKKPEA
jgi:F0F1-type ATP synthase assembly protein I